MPPKGRIYRLTEAGRKAWDSHDAQVPAEYRRILGVIDAEAHSDVIRAFLRRYPDTLIFEWLAELEELELLSSRSAEVEHDLDFTGSLRLPDLIAEDRKRLAEEAKDAQASLTRRGVYVAADRIKNRAPLTKAKSDTTVLIVEDDSDQLILARLRVTLAGFPVRTAENAAALLNTLKTQGPPDLLLLDVMLPDGDGFDILSDLRRSPDTALLPIVMLTVKDSPADISRGLALGADGYVTKPYSKTALAETIKRVLVQG